MSKFKQQHLRFSDGVNDVQITFTPEESDWWGSYTVNGITYDVHYLEDEDMEIEVYSEGVFSLPIHLQKIAR